MHLSAAMQTKKLRDGKTFHHTWRHVVSILIYPFPTITIRSAILSVFWSRVAIETRSRFGTSTRQMRQKLWERTELRNTTKITSRVALVTIFPVERRGCPLSSRFPFLYTAEWTPRWLQPKPNHEKTHKHMIREIKTVCFSRALANVYFGDWGTKPRLIKTPYFVKTKTHQQTFS